MKVEVINNVLNAMNTKDKKAKKYLIEDIEKMLVAIGCLICFPLIYLIGKIISSFF